MNYKSCLFFTSILALSITLSSCSAQSAKSTSNLKMNSNLSASSGVQNNSKGNVSSTPRLSSSQQTSGSARVSETAPTGSPSSVSPISNGVSGMYNFYCFDGSLYKLVDSSKISKYSNIIPPCILTYKPSELSSNPIGVVYYPLDPTVKETDTVYGINNVQILKDVNMPQSIAIKLMGKYYCRADYFTSDLVKYNNQTYQIAPISIVGAVTAEKLLPYSIYKKIGETTEKFDVYSLKSPQKPKELAFDIPGMTCQVGTTKLYPLAVLK